MLWLDQNHGIWTIYYHLIGMRCSSAVSRLFPWCGWVGLWVVICQKWSLYDSNCLSLSWALNEIFQSVYSFTVLSVLFQAFYGSDITYCLSLRLFFIDINVLLSVTYMYKKWAKRLVCAFIIKMQFFNRSKGYCDKRRRRKILPTYKLQNGVLFYIKGLFS